MNLLNPMDALDVQLAMVRFYRSEEGQRYVQQQTRGFEGAMQRGPLVSALVPNQLAIMDKVAKGMADNLNEAQTYIVFPHIVTELWKRAGELTFQPLLPQDLPDPRGFVLLGQNLYIHRHDGKRCSIRAILWNNDYSMESENSERGITITAFSDLQDPHDEYNCASDGYLPPQPGHNMVNTHPWIFGQTPLDLVWPDEELEEAVLDSWRFMSFCQQLWAFVQDQIPNRAVPYRQLRHRLLRVGSPLVDVKVVDLRAIESSGPNPDAIAQDILWSHRWRVRKHLRRQWYPSLGIHKVIAIESFVKGPDDLPLIEKDVVARVKR